MERGTCAGRAVDETARVFEIRAIEHLGTHIHRHNPVSKTKTARLLKWSHWELMPRRQCFAVDINTRRSLP